MTLILAFLFAQSLFGDLSRNGAKPAEPVVAPYAAANVEANTAVMAENAPAETAEEEAAPEAEPEPEPEATPEPEPEATPEPELETTPEPEPGVSEPEPEATPEPEPESPESSEPSEPAESSESEKVSKQSFEMPRSVKITSERTDYDRREGVIMFDKDVFVDDAEYKMHSDQLYVFLDGTNELKRIVAIGNVSITNETRVGSCAKAAYTKSVGKVVMYGDSNGVRARLADYGKRKSEVEGRKITFWIDSEQVEVEGSTVTLDAGGYGGKEGAKKLLGK